MVNTELLTGRAELLNLCKLDGYDLLVMGISGCAGIEPTVIAARANKRIALANKESVVSAGNVLRKIVETNSCTIIPVDSEHNAIYQCMPIGNDGVLPDTNCDTPSICRLSSEVVNSIRRLILTSSGGPFRKIPLSEYGSKKMSDNISHPVWSMGAKITIDSSTMMNKGLEVLEAHYLYGVPIDKIDVLVHPECIIHSMVEFIDRSIISQMYLPDMKLPIAYSLNWPQRTFNNLEPLDLTTKTLTFSKPDLEQFPCLKLAYEVGKQSGLYPAAFNAANDQANELFRKDFVTFNQLYQLIQQTVHEFNDHIYDPFNIEDVLAVDRWSREHVLSLYRRYYE